MNPLELYEKMVTIRMVEDRLQKLCDEGKAGDLHFNKGQEAIAVGVCAALESYDRIVTHHRTIAHYIAKGGELYPLIAELLGKKTGICEGRAGEMHISNKAIGYDFSFQLVGTCIPVAAGLAWGLRNFKGGNEVVVAFFGDASMSNGQFHEGLNIAAIHKLPILFVCEDNHLAGNITPSHYTPSPNHTYQRFESYGIPTVNCNGNNVLEVMDEVGAAIRHVRRGVPCALVCETTRLCWHKQGQRDVRPPEVLAELAKRDPIEHLQKTLLLAEHKEETTKIRIRVSETLNQIFAQVEKDPLPEVYID